MFKTKNNRECYKKIAEDTYAFIKKNNLTTESDIHINNLERNSNHDFKTTFNVLDESCVKTTINLKELGGKIGLMNFASAKNVGGGFLSGANAQEEAIARVSNLSTEQEKFMKEYYEFNRKDNHFGLYTGRFIYSKDITIFKNDDGVYLTGNKITKTDVVTIPAPNRSVSKKYPSEVTNSDVKDALRNRIDNTLRAFAENGCEHLVLGAFGCGVFGNSPTDVAKIFRQRFVKGGEFHNTFKSVTFSVIKGKWSNYDVFKHYFLEKEID